MSDVTKSISKVSDVTKSISKVSDVTKSISKVSDVTRISKLNNNSEEINKRQISFLSLLNNAIYSFIHILFVGFILQINIH